MSDCGGCGSGDGRPVIVPIFPFPNPLDAVRIGCLKCILGWILILVGLVVLARFWG